MLFALIDASHLMITSDVDEPAEKPTATYLIERRSAQDLLNMHDCATQRV